mmetsp:Transcript_68539/g.155320  ORF Transcript_68539/g.155320 Transcript_68539/m.155320 type:complete len:157 (+) Transcript_68539:117-587(+)
MAGLLRHPDHMKLSKDWPRSYPELQDHQAQTVVRIDIRGHNGSIQPDSRFIEEVFVDGELGPMLLTSTGEYKHWQHNFIPGWGKRDIISVYSKRWSCASSSEKEILLHMAAKMNWTKRGQLDESHPEYRDRADAAAELVPKPAPPKKKKSPMVILC